MAVAARRAIQPGGSAGVSMGGGASVGGAPGGGPPGGGGSDKPLLLPEIRQDLRLVDAPADLTGARRWMIHDPIQHRFFSIGQTAHVLFRVWRAGATADAIIEQAWTHHSETIERTDIEQFIRFLQSSGLTVEAAGGGWRGFWVQDVKKRGAILSRILHGYLFFKVPLFRPEPFLDRTLDIVRPLGTGLAGIITAAMGLVGLYLVSREWDQFLTTFADIFTLEGALTMAIALPIVKLMHEFGHAYTAHFYGSRVPVIGVAFVLGFPMLYADVTDTCRLKSRRQRMYVDGAGILVDLSVASIATLLWAFLPPGPAKSLAFSLATAGWILSLTMNLNPFMKFDGYHILTSLVGIDNLQSRAMALARWRMREALFAIDAPPPEPMARAERRLMTLYGVLTWIYRLVLFLGIALAVYQYFFKLAGVVLFLIEIGYFILWPLWREAKEWYAMRKAILRSSRTYVTASIMALGIIALIVPWSSRVVVPAVIEAAVVAPLHPPVAAEIKAIHVRLGATVVAGQPVLSLVSTPLVQELEVTERRLEIVRLRQSRRASDAADKGDSVVLDSEHAALIARRQGLRKQLAELDVVAPLAGDVAEIAIGLHPGRWVKREEALVVVRANDAVVVRGYLPAAAVWRVREGAPARFVPDDIALPSRDATVTSMALTSSEALDQIELVAEYGGRVATRPDARKRPIPVDAQYSLRAKLADGVDQPYLARTVPGVLIVEGARESILAGLWRQVLKVLVRESGF